MGLISGSGVNKINHINVMLNRDSNPGPQVVDALDNGDLRSLAHFVHLLSADYIFCVVSFVQLLSIFVVSLSLSLSVHLFYHISDTPFLSV